MTARASTAVDPATVETQIWLEEHQWLHSLFDDRANVSPTFRFPDLISACVSLILAQPDTCRRIFRYLGEELVMRNPRTPRRREYMWRAQFEELRRLQLSPANQHPNPMFQLDQLTTACVALVRASPRATEAVYQQARTNMCQRARTQVL